VPFFSTTDLRCISDASVEEPPFVTIPDTNFISALKWDGCDMCVCACVSARVCACVRARAGVLPVRFSMNV
jgi:hypothetical protein